MIFNPPLRAGCLLRRYRRFLADIALENGEIITAHCPNPGSMKTCLGPGWPVRVSYHTDPRRKLAYTLEMIHNGQCWIGVNTLRTNAVVAEALALQQIPELAEYSDIRPEVPYGDKSRIDFLLSGPGLPDCYLEVKHVSLLLGQEYAFPDAVTLRGRKHLQELLQIQQQGARAVQIFVVQRSDGVCFRAAHEIDPDYAQTLCAAKQAGLEVLVYGVTVTPTGLKLGAAIPFSLLNP